MEIGDVIEVGRVEGLKKELMAIAEELEPGELRFVWSVSFLPPDWESYYRHGCDTDGGNYCYSNSLVVWKNPRTNEVEYYIIEESTRELGEGKGLVMTPRGHLLAVPERQYYEDDHQVWIPVTGSLEDLYGPYSLDEVAREWLAIEEASHKEWEAYEEWVSRRFG